MASPTVIACFIAAPSGRPRPSGTLVRRINAGYRRLAKRLTPPGAFAGCPGSTAEAAGDSPRQRLAFLEIALGRLGGRGGADAVGDREAAVAAIVGAGETLLPARRRAFGLDQRLHPARPFRRVLRRAERAQEGERAHDLGQAQQLFLVRGGRRLALRRRRCRLRGRDGGRRGAPGLRAAAALLRFRRGGERQRHDGDRRRMGEAPHAAPAFSISNALRTTPARPGVVRSAAISSSKTQRTSDASGPTLGSPARQRAAWAQMTKWCLTRPAASRSIASTWSTKPRRSASTPTSSRSSRKAASASVSPGSTRPPGRL